MKTLVQATIAAGLLTLSHTAPAMADDAADLARYRAAEKIGKELLAKFDTLDFDVYSNQKWDQFAESHSPDILVHYPDGHTTKGLDAHIAELKFMFTWAPDTKVDGHPVRITDGEWTSVVGTMKGTFTKPLNFNGTTIPPTGKSFSLKMVTVAHWNKNGVMDEEYLFWDNAAMMKQLSNGQ